MKKAGISIIVLGLSLIILATFTSFATDSKEIINSKPHHLIMFPLIGIAVLGIGALVLQRSS